MNLHNDRDSFSNLAVLTSSFIGVPESAVMRDYYIVLMLQRLSQSKYAERCVFKGGTSLSKSYPGSIQRFSEDIDLTYIPDNATSKKQYDKALKGIEAIMSEGANVQKIPEERNDRNKSSYVWFDDENSRIKLEIGSSIRPDPFEKRSIRSYIQEYLESQNMTDVVEEFELQMVSLNTLGIERTFLDKVMAVKRHAICGTLQSKVRHIYDVTVLSQMPEIQSFLNNQAELKALLRKTKDTDSFYLEKRNIAKEYDPTGAYDFLSWKRYFDQQIKARYETLHEDLLYTNERQNFEDAIKAFKEINDIFKAIGE